MNLKQIMKLKHEEPYSPAEELMTLVGQTIGPELRRLRAANEALAARVDELEQRPRRVTTRTRTRIIEQVTETSEEW
jgi:hypothetical protein